MRFVLRFVTFFVEVAKAMKIWKSGCSLGNNDAYDKPSSDPSRSLLVQLIYCLSCVRRDQVSLSFALLWIRHHSIALSKPETMAGVRNLVVAYDNAPPGAPRDFLATAMANMLNGGPPLGTRMVSINHVCFRLVTHGNITGPGILLNNIINALIAAGDPHSPNAMPFGNAHTAITAFLVRQLAVYPIPGPIRGLILLGLLQELRLATRRPPGEVYDIAPVPAYRMALQSIIQEASPGVPNAPALHNALITFLHRHLHDKMDRPGPTWYSIANVLCLEANIQPWVYTSHLVSVVDAILRYSFQEYMARVHTPNNVTICLIQQAGQYPANVERRDITDTLLRQTRLPNCPLQNRIMRALTALVRTYPPTNIVDHKSMNSLWPDEKTLLNEFLRLQGITVAPPNVPPGLAGVPGGPGGQWTLCYTLGSGGEGIAYLYAYIDGRRTIRDRVVQRNVISDWTFWNRIERWHLGLVGGTPTEAWLMGLFNNSPNVVGYRSFSVNANNWIYTTYIDYVEHGSLEDLIHSHRGNPYVSVSISDLLAYANTLRSCRIKPFDESFLWHLFRSLARGLRDMHAALPAPLPGAPVPNVPNVVHGDLHCGNVFLGREDNTIFRLYPTPKVRIHEPRTSRRENFDVKTICATCHLPRGRALKS